MHWNDKDKGAKEKWNNREKEEGMEPTKRYDAKRGSEEERTLRLPDRKTDIGNYFAFVFPGISYSYLLAKSRGRKKRRAGECVRERRNLRRTRKIRMRENK